jgi:gluconokinase
MVVIVMGVAGAGKSTIGKMLADTLGWEFVDADELHPSANIDKMRRGIPLTDEDRQSWLLALHSMIRRWLSQDREAVLACSALTQQHRQTLLVDRNRVRFVYLKGSYELIATRLAQRRHFMAAELLPSPFDLLEEPTEAITVDVAKPPEAIVADIKTRLGGR